jgi:hypothetical protein
MKPSAFTEYAQTVNIRRVSEISLNLCDFETKIISIQGVNQESRWVCLEKKPFGPKILKYR